MQILISILIFLISAFEGALIIGILFGLIFAVRIKLFYGSRSPDEMAARFYLLPKPFRLNWTQVLAAIVAIVIVYESWSMNKAFRILIDNMATSNHVNLTMEIWANGAGWFMGLLFAAPLGRQGIRPIFKKCQNLPF
jgi:xanthine/uracil permease